MSSQPGRTKVFISYSHHDDKYLKRLAVHLEPYRRSGAIEIWSDTQIQPGALWRDEVANAIATTKVAILLVSADFLASKFIAEHELPPLLAAAQTEGAVILPVVVGACNYDDSDLAPFQAINAPSRAIARLSPAKRDEEWAKVARLAKQALESQAFEQHDQSASTILERIRAFRAERLVKIEAGETLVQLPNGAKIVLHLVPFAALDSGANYPVTAPEQRNNVFASLHPIGAPAIFSRINFDGVLKYDEDSYVQFFHNGCVEAVDTELLRQYMGRPIIPGIDYEHSLIVALRAYLPFLDQVGVKTPIAVMLSLLGVSGYVMGVDPQSRIQRNENPIDRSDLIVPEEVIDTYDRAAEDILKPCFDAIWNATGWERSMHYDAEGRWLSPYR